MFHTSTEPRQRLYDVCSQIVSTLWSNLWSYILTGWVTLYSQSLTLHLSRAAVARQWERHRDEAVLLPEAASAISNGLVVLVCYTTERINHQTFVTPERDWPALLQIHHHVPQWSAQKKINENQLDSSSFFCWYWLLRYNHLSFPFWSCVKLTHVASLRLLSSSRWPCGHFCVVVRRWSNIPLKCLHQCRWSFAYVFNLLQNVSLHTSQMDLHTQYVAHLCVPTH